MPRPPLADLALALALFAVAVAEVLGAPIAEDVVRGGTALNLAAVALATLPLAYRRRAPFVVAALVLGAWAGRALAGPPLEIYPLAIASIVAVYSVAAYGSLRDALLGFGCSPSPSPSRRRPAPAATRRRTCCPRSCSPAASGSSAGSPGAATTRRWRWSARA